MLLGTIESYSYLSMLLLLLLAALSCAVAEDPTTGFTAVPLTEAQFPVQKPYDVPLDQRYDFVGGVRRMWVYSTDKPHSPRSHTKPRTEIGIKQNYSSGVWQFEGYGYVPSGTTGVSVMQVFGAVGYATTLMLHVYDGALRYYHRQVVEDGIYDRWFRLNVVHDVDASNLTVFVDGVEKLRVPGHPGRSVHTFKFGVYTQTDPSYRMESRWRDVQVFTKAR